MANDDDIAQKNADVLRFMKNALYGGTPLSVNLNGFKAATDGRKTTVLRVADTNRWEAGGGDVNGYLAALRTIPVSEQSELVKDMATKLQDAKTMPEKGSNTQVSRKEYLKLLLKEMKENVAAAVATLDDPLHNPHEGYKGRPITAESINPARAKQKTAQEKTVGDPMILEALRQARSAGVNGEYRHTTPDAAPSPAVVKVATPEKQRGGIGYFT